jgi:hypothetical protein
LGRVNNFKSTSFIQELEDDIPSKSGREKHDVVIKHNERNITGNEKDIRQQIPKLRIPALYELAEGRNASVYFQPVVANSWRRRLLDQVEVAQKVHAESGNGSDISANERVNITQDEFERSQREIVSAPLKIGAYFNRVSIHSFLL